MADGEVWYESEFNKAQKKHSRPGPAHCRGNDRTFRAAWFSYAGPGGSLHQMAEELHERERTIKAARGRILDVNGTVIADNRTVCTISVITAR